MRGYGRDYDDRNWLDRPEDTVRGWFGGGRDYDRDYGWSGGDRDMSNRGDWSRGPDRARPGEGYRTNNWNNQHAGWDTVNRAGSYYGMDYQDRDRQGYRAGGSDYDRDFGRGWSRDRSPGASRGMGGGSMGGRGMGGRGMGGRGMTSGGMPDRGMSDRGMRGGGQGDVWMTEAEHGGYGDRPGTAWGDYNPGGGYGGGGRFRNSTSGGVQPGRYFRGYGNGSTGGSGYEPY
ncbi:MAG TPA: hypothetical protein VGO40_16000 [Longimicrobium sp.]|nr:hypothetical protein [Longimicrobium sp.]